MDLHRRTKILKILSKRLSKQLSNDLTKDEESQVKERISVGNLGTNDFGSESWVFIMHLPVTQSTDFAFEPNPTVFGTVVAF